MKKLVIIFSILFVASFSLQAQKKEVKTKEAKSYKKTESTNKKSDRKLNTALNVVKRKATNTKTVGANTNRKSRSNSRVVATRPDRQLNTENKRSTGIAVKNRKIDFIGRRNIRNERHPVSIVKTPRINNVKIRHGYIDYSSRRTGYAAHNIMIFPMRVRYPFYQNYNFMLMHSYRPEIEYPWAIYESDNRDHTASIEGKVVDVDYNRRTNQYILHFGRKSPHQSATVIIPDYLAQYLNIRDVRKLNRDYVSVYGKFTNYGNVPTIVLNSLDEIFVNEMPLQDFFYYQ